MCCVCRASLQAVRGEHVFCVSGVVTGSKRGACVVCVGRRLKVRGAWRVECVTRPLLAVRGGHVCECHTIVKQ